MSSQIRIAFIGNSLPRLCGIATFTSHLQQAVAEIRPGWETTIVAMTDHDENYPYPPEVFTQIHDQKLGDYVRAAMLLNAGDYEVVSLQHEFGIFGGEAGSHILELLQRLTIPVVTTFHTVLEKPTEAQRRVVKGIVAASARVVVMAQKGQELLKGVYNVPADKIEVIAHGIPDLAFEPSAHAKSRLGYLNKSVILTFGLLCPNKGIEVMVDAMPAILRKNPDSIYVVLGATHPNLVREQGEAYREGLMERAKNLNVEDSIVFLDKFVDEATLLEHISACDVYVTPYLNRSQMTSGTLAYSFGLGKAVVSTPYWHAEELLADGLGTLVPFGDTEALGEVVADLVADDVKRAAIQSRAYSASRCMVWAEAAKRYANVMERVLQTRRLRVVPPNQPSKSVPRPVRALPDINTRHFLSLCDDTGLFQHAVFAVPDRNHGYCIDDNARALILACMLQSLGKKKLPDTRLTQFAAFLQHAWNADNKRFRNFMGFDRRWLEDKGSEDSHGRTIWALGVCAANNSDPSLRSWAQKLMAESIVGAEQIGSPRAWAFILLGLSCHCAGETAVRLRSALSERLMSLLIQVERPDWVWFEEGLSYDNARLPQALIAIGLSTGSTDHVAAGLRSLRWLMALQTSKAGYFQPVGSQSFGEAGISLLQFDQQPVEAAASVAACRTAHQAEPRDDIWRQGASMAFNWFLGGNQLMVPLADVNTGRCRDGLHPDRANENCGAESALSYLAALADMHLLSDTIGDHPLVQPLDSVRQDEIPRINLRRN